MVDQIRGPYRRTLLQKRLQSLLPQHDVSAPRDYSIRLPHSLRWTRPLVARFLIATVRSVTEARPWQARLAWRHTRITAGREEKYWDLWVNEKDLAHAYNQ